MPFKSQIIFLQTFPATLRVEVEAMLQPRIAVFNFLYPFGLYNRRMTIQKKLITLALLLSLTLSTSEFYSSSTSSISAKKGLTFQATVWPQERNNYVGRMSCNGCNPQTGDTSCTERLPVTCIIHPKTLARPFYNYYSDYTPYNSPDAAFYEGWTGGIIAVTDPVRGLDISSYAVGDNVCKTAFGPSAKFAMFTDGWYIPFMNGPSVAIQRSWDWGKAKSGEYNFWGYFNHDHIGKSWIWTQTTPTGNCIISKSNPIL